MLKQQFIDIVNKPHNFSSNDLNDLEVLINEYPYFETAHLLYINALSKHNHIHYSKQLRQTALVVNSRNILYNLLHQKSEIKIITHEETKIVPEATTSVHVTNNDIKVVYVNTSSNPPLSEKIIETKEAASELDIIKQIENNTESPNQTFNENESIEREISLGLVQSYVETDIIKTPELDKKENQEPLSFVDWLNRVKKEGPSIQPPEHKKEEKPKKTENREKKSPYFEQNQQIINKIIDSDPGKIKLSPSKFYTANTDAKQSLLENEHLVTETLAKIYALQGNISKAIRAYEILSLKFPQKSVYFTSLIEKLKTNK